MVDLSFIEYIVQMVGTVSTAEEFWQVQQLLYPPSALPDWVDLALFRAGVAFPILSGRLILLFKVAPDWENDGNKAGGR